MATLFYDNFLNVGQWTGSDIVSVSNPLNPSLRVATFSSVSTDPKSLSKVIYNTGRSYQVSFDYLGLSNNVNIGVNLGCILSVNDGGSLGDLTTAYAGSIKNSAPPDCRDRIVTPNDCNDPCNVDRGGDCASPSLGHLGAVFLKEASFIKLIDNGQWSSYNFSFSATNTAIRIALSDYRYGDGRNEGVARDCYFANLLVTDSEGPSPSTTVAPTTTITPISITPIPLTSTTTTITTAVPAAKTPATDECNISNSQCNVDLSHSTINAPVTVSQTCNQVTYCITGSTGALFINPEIETSIVKGFNPQNSKIDVSAFDCIRQSLGSSCFTSNNGKTCNMRLVDQVSSSLDRASTVVLDNLGLDFVLGKDSFVGDAVDSICRTSSASSYNIITLGLVTTIMILFEM